eukprot:CAMPEP_0205806572 /NCGR_PEP_ID=MMETSP0205-20121125/10172_1 /ASSEMBLY_ACC=CAM_ASM_000278 /TAXON_ID=36767 /ORGANISM="Euplotes focardii, Strain TN1" /LENGTH=154 /DNA_ID=CAMNT_0053079677 /DNA_START=1011 /DNA_END=1472 /DNA_ORIENTATION=+
MLGYAGGVAGLFAIYLLPVMLHLKRSYLSLTNPMLLKMLEKKMIISYDDIGEYENIFNNPKLSPSVNQIPKNHDLRMSLIEPIPEESSNGYVDSNFEQIQDLSKSINSDKSVSKTTNEKINEILNEIKLDKVNDRQSTKLSFMISVVVDSLAVL